MSIAREEARTRLCTHLCTHLRQRQQLFHAAYLALLCLQLLLELGDLLEELFDGGHRLRWRFDRQPPPGLCLGQCWWNVPQERTMKAKLGEMTFEPVVKRANVAGPGLAVGSDG